MDRARLARMKEDAVLLSAGRGTVLDQDALVELMNGGHLWGTRSGRSPRPEPLPEDSPLWDVPNLLLTSHVAGGLRLPVTRENCVRLALENLKRVSGRRAPGKCGPGGAEADRILENAKSGSPAGFAFDCFVRRKEWKIELQRFFDKPTDKSGYRGLVNFLTFCK